MSNGRPEYYSVYVVGHRVRHTVGALGSPFWRRALASTGRTLISAGVLILLFVAYQLWGTGLAEARAQDRLRADFLDVIAAPRPPAPSPSTTDAVSTSSTSTPRAAPSGEAVAIIRIPKIEVEKAVVEGVSVEALKKGPGHYPSTPLPGEPGNAAIAGHRTTYGAPFFRLHQLVAGDKIEVTTRAGEFTYEVVGSQIVKPSQNEVLLPTEDNRLTLTTCNPKYSAAQRLIVTARLLDPPSPFVVPRAAGDDDARDAAAAAFADETVSGADVPRTPTMVWGGLTAGVWLATAVLARRWGRLAAYAMGVPVFLVVLFIFFENVARLLPANV